MKENKKDSNKKVDDLKFMPLDIKDPLKFLNSDLINLSSTEAMVFSSSSDLLLKGFPQLNINMLMELPELKISESKIPQMKYPENIPNLNSEDLLNYNTSNENSPENILKEQTEYPSETNIDELYSYNKPTVGNRYKDDYNYEPINPVDILRNFDLLDDFDEDSRHGYTQKDINNILNEIIENNISIMAVMKAYRVPYPIAKLLIKKIIRITLDQCKR